MADEKKDQAPKKADAAPLPEPRPEPPDHDRAIEEAIAAERAVKPEVDRASYGPFADHPQKFVVVAEMVGKHPRGSEISYRELMTWHGGDRQRPNVGGTKANAERLVEAGHIRPLIATGA